jgi:apolipoprotein D and lipocalin family protein
MKRLIAITTVLGALFLGCATRPAVDLTPVNEVQLSRYLGSWYEIARYDHWFERDMSHTKAHYEARKDGHIAVTNTGLKNGKAKTATAIAETTGTPGLLRVSFFRPFYGDYRILWLDGDYRHALVGGDDAGYLWILAREPKISGAMRETLLAEARRRGYDTSRLIWVGQE